MQKHYFHNSTSINESNNYKKIPLTNIKDTKIVVDINMLLNRVKMNQKNEQKQKVIFLCSAILVVGMTGLLFL